MSTKNTEPTFKVGTGAIFLPSSKQAAAHTVISQEDGAILLGGYVIENSFDFMVVRLLADGSLDTTFGNQGFVVTDNNSSYNISSSMVLQEDGKILIGGVANVESFSGGSQDFMLARYLGSGILDKSYGVDGIVTTDIQGGNYYSDSLWSLNLQKDGKLIVSGKSGDSFNNPSIVLVRYNNDGTLDKNFGEDGVVNAFINGFNNGHKVGIQQDGKIVITEGSGFFYGEPESKYQFTTKRFNADGGIDASFGVEGVVKTDVGGQSSIPLSLLIQADGRILIAGDSSSGPGHSEFKMVRYNKNGDLDVSFSGDGVFDVNLSEKFNFSFSSQLQQNDGKILLVGSSYNILEERYCFSLVRLKTNGEIDDEFGVQGLASFGELGWNSSANDAVVLHDGKILIVGSGLKESHNETIILSRLNYDGTLDLNFNSREGLSTLDNLVVYTEGALPVMLDENVRVYDEQLSKLGNYQKSSLILSRSGSASADDQFSGAGIILGQSSGNLVVAGVIIGSYIYNAGSIEIYFNGNATQAYVNQALQSLSYKNVSDSPPSSIELVWTFNDGNEGSQGGGGALSTTGSSTVKIASINDHPVGAVTILGSPVQGRLLTPLISFTDPDGIPIHEVSYTWYAQGSNTPVGYSSNGTTAAYVPNEADVGKALRVVASYVDGGGTQEQVASEYTQIVISNNPNFYVSKIIDPEGLYLTEGKSYVVGSVGLSAGDYVPKSITLFQGSKPFFSKLAPIELLRNQDGSFGLLFGSGVSWVQQKFDQDGIAVGKALKLSFPAFLSLESQFDKDINGDGSIGDTVAQNLAQGNGVGLYKTTSGSLVVDAIGLDAGDALGNLLTLSVGTKLFAPKVRPSGLVLYQDGSFGVLSGAGSAWTEQKFGSNGMAIGKAVKLTITDVLAKESLLQVDLNGDGKLGDAVKAVLDYDGYANNAPLLGLYSTDSGGYALDADGLDEGQSFTELFTLLKVGAKPWAVKAGTEILGIAERSNGNIEVLLKTGSALSAQQFDVDTGLAIGKTVKLKAGSPDITARETYYELDLDSTAGVDLIGVTEPPTGW